MASKKITPIRFVYWLMENCELIVDQETEENVLWRFAGEDYTVQCLYNIYEQITNSLGKFYTGWIKVKYIGDENYLGYSENGIIKYGISSDGEWFEGNDGTISSDDYKASPKSIQAALTKEALKRGFVDGAHYQWEYCPLRKVNGNDFIFEGGVFRINGFSIMDSEGKWAEIIKTITKEEAEKKLNCKII